MAKFPKPLTVAEVAALVGGSVVGDPDYLVQGPGAIEQLEPDGIVFAESAEYAQRALECGYHALITVAGVEAPARSLIQVDQPRIAFFRLLQSCVRPHPLTEGVHPLAFVSPGANVHPSARIGAFAYIGSEAVIGPQSVIYPFAYVGEGAHLGTAVVLYPHSVVMSGIHLGNHVTLQPHAVIGADGFGYVWDGQRQMKVPQVGRVVIGDNVEVGAGSTIDRGTAAETRIGEGTKLDNLVMIGHNAEIGKHGVIASQTGIGGSAKIGDRAVMAGQAGVADHVTITDDVTLATRSGVAKDLEDPGVYLGFPARPVNEERRAMAAYAKLPELVRRLKKLEMERKGEP